MCHRRGRDDFHLHLHLELRDLFPGDRRRFMVHRIASSSNSTRPDHSPGRTDRRASDGRRSASRRPTQLEKDLWSGTALTFRKEEQSNQRLLSLDGMIIGINPCGCLRVKRARDLAACLSPLGSGSISVGFFLQDRIPRPARSSRSRKRPNLSRFLSQYRGYKCEIRPYSRRPQ
jgi:hypothetical protein